MHGWVKLNCDGSFSPDGRAGSGFILRDEHGMVIFSACRQFFFCRDALDAELGGCMEGLSQDMMRTDLPIALELESSSAMKMILSRDTDRSIYSSLIEEIKYLMSLRRTSVTQITCCQNKVCDSLASFARLEGRTMTWLGDVPPSALEFYEQDYNPYMV